MRNIYEIRRENLARLLMGYTTQRQFSHDTGIAAGHLSQMVNGSRDMGTHIAKRIELALGLAAGSMSVEQGIAPAAPLIIDPVQWLPADELKLLVDYRKLPPRHKTMIREMTKNYVIVEQKQGAA